MYTKRNYSFIAMLFWTRRYIYRFLLLAMIPVVLYHGLDWQWLHLPWTPIAMIGGALAFIIGFKNNASYGRLWEARKIWGGIVNTSRSLTMMANDYISNDASEEIYSEEELFSIRKTIVLRHVAWMTSLRHALRATKPWEMSNVNKSDAEFMRRIEVKEKKYSVGEELDGYLSEEEFKYVLSKKNKQNTCLNLQSKHFKKLRDSGHIEHFRHLDMERLLVELFTLQGKAERIKNFPYPRQFATLNRAFILIFVILLPFGLLNFFHEIGNHVVEEVRSTYFPYPEGGYHHIIELIGDNFVFFTIPFSVIISWVFHTMERIGEVSENPFEGIANDVPITTMARGIEIDIREMIDDNPDEIPAPIKEQMGIQM